MKYGLSLPNGGEGCDARTLAELAALAESAGWDGVFLEDYVVWQGHQDVPTYDPWVALAAIALRTERVRIGTSVTPLSRRRPWKLAREAMTLDHLSNGRLILGVGVGDVGDPGFAHVGEVSDTKQRAAMLDEALHVLVGLWSGKPFSYDGAHYHVRDLTLLPPPVQTPRIPIWVGGNWPLKGPTRRAARWDGFMGGKVHAEGEYGQLTPEDVRQLKADIAGYRTAAELFDIVLGGAERDSDWELERTRIRALAEAGATWWSEYVPPSIGGLEAMRARISSGPLRID
jgi:alkanesulfonate monooxygenase SsuD/methylene tetrahydromethanopterin reductase-like flavin-dependent oxidoreductase (luciferase family)